MACDVENIKKDRLRYTKNKLSANLALVGILFNVLYFVNIYQSDVNNYYYTITIGLSVVYNLVFLLLAFLSSEGVKTYNNSYAWLLIVIGVLQVVRIIGIPKMAHSTVTQVGGVDTLVMSDRQFMTVVLFLLLSAAACVLGGITGLVKNHTLEKYKKENGYV